MNEQQILQQLNRPGWKKTGERPEMGDVTNTRTGETTKQATGNTIWVITGPSGQSDEVTVKQTAPASGGEEASPQAASYSVIAGPKNNIQQPSTQTRSNYQHYTDPKTGQVYESWDGHPWSKAEGLPPDSKAAGPTPASGLETINDPTTGKPIKLRDPVTGTVIDLPNATPTRPSVVDGPNGSKYSWDGETLKQVLAGTTPSVPKEGDSRQSVIPGTQYIGQETFHNGVWSIDSGFTPKPYVPTDKPKDGDVRPNTDGKGQAIQEVFRGGSWVTDTSIAPKPFGTQQPTTLNTGTGPYIVQQTPDQALRGETTNVPNPNTTDVVARTQQLQNAARTKSSELQQAVQSGRTTPEQAATDFDTWWETNIAPQSQQITQTQQAQQFDYQTKQREQQRLEEAQQTSNLSTAQQAGRDAVSAYNDQSKNRVGPGYGQAFVDALNSWKSGKPAPDITPDAVMYQAPDMTQMYEQAVARSLAHISPTAASIAGRPMPQIPQSFDVAGALNKSSYAPRGTTLVHPDGTVEIKPPDQASQPSGAQVGLGPYMMPDYSPAAAPF